jgi:UDP-N-acetylmuramoyl-tripeptide--D-alanyl-D-alanine ligase
MSVERVRQAVHGVLVCGHRDFEITGVSTDSRSVRPGDFFVALCGDRFDGHDYVRTALAAGACGAMYSKDFQIFREDAQKALIKVSDTLAALGDMARAYRKDLQATVVGVTGSNGKTTTKEMTRWLLEEKMATVASPGSFNNFIGLPLTLFSTDSSTRAVVLEMGTNHPGEIARLADIACPDVAVITNVGRTHLEGLGSIEGVAAAKGEILHGLSRDGAAILNADDPNVMRLRNLTASKVFTFGLQPSCDIFATKVERTETGFAFQINDAFPARLNVPGVHNVRNALAAVSVARKLGLDLRYLAARLEGFRLPPMRLEERRLCGAVVINDAYNANPDSMAGAIEEFAARRAQRKFFVFADMLELGEMSGELHRELGSLAARARFDFYWAMGREARGALDAIEASGVPAANVRHFETVDDLAAALSRTLSPGDAALVKGSRGMGLERIIKLLG